MGQKETAMIELQKALLFAEWLDTNAVRAGHHIWTSRHDNWKNKYTTMQMLDIYTKTLK